MTETFDERSAQSFELLLDAHFSPADRRARAVQQARLQSKIGGHEILNTDAIAEPAHTSSFLACFPRMRQWYPIFAEVDLCSADPVPWIREVRQAYESLRLRRSAIADVYTGYAQELHHYCDGDTTRQRFRPKDLASAKTVPPFRHLVDDSSMKPPAQRQLASIVHHEGWLACYEANQAADSAAAASGTDTRHLREATRIVGTSQPRAGSILRELPTSPDTRRQPSRWLWAMQRRYGL